MNSVFDSFILRHTASIQHFTSSMVDSIVAMVSSSSLISKHFQIEWSSTYPLSCRSFGIISLRHSLWRGWHPVWILVGHWILMFFLVSSCCLYILWNFLVWDIVHTSIGLSFILNFLTRTSSSTLWLTVLKAADRSRIMTGVMFLFSIPHSASFVSLSRLVLQLKFFLLANWYSGSRLCLSQWSLNCWRVHFSATLDMNGRLLTGW